MKKKSRTALALDMMAQQGLSVRSAAMAVGVTRQSVYRLIGYRAAMEARATCPVCGKPCTKKNAPSIATQGIPAQQPNPWSNEND